MSYPVAVIGASFAGVAVVRQLRGKVLVLDRTKPGAVQSSACGLPLDWVEYLGLRGAVLYSSPWFRCVMNGLEVPLKVDTPFCTVDYRKFCEDGIMRSHVDFVQTNVRRVEGRTIHTEAGTFEAEVIVNASGWNSFAREGPPPPKGVGVETEIPSRDEAFEFRFDDPFLRNGYGYAWAFPCGETTRFGVIKYYGEHNLKNLLSDWLAEKGLKVGKLHGGAVPFVPDAVPVRENVFDVGDSAGQCFPLTGEGIRPGMYFSTLLGWLLQEWNEGKRTLDEVRRDYLAVVERETRRLGQVHYIQRVVNRWPTAMAILLRWGTRGRFFEYAAGKYLRCYRPPADPAAELRAALAPAT